MEFRILGPLEVLDGERTVRIAGPRERALLAMLLLRPGQVVSTDRLIDLLWGDRPPGHPVNALQAVVTRVRRALGPRGRDLLVTKAPGYCLAVTAEHVDALRFEGLVNRGSELVERDPATASSLLRQALARWRGPALEDLAGEHLIQQETARLEALRLAALENRIEADLTLGRHAEVIDELESLVTEHPYRERFRAQLMLALYRSGRQADALGVYQRTRTLLAEELGLDPGPMLQELHERVLRQEPSLSIPARTRDRRGHSLPARISSFVGRELELQDVRQLLARSRLVTVIGPGGSGKTSLAIEAARAIAEVPADGPGGGVYFVDLAPVSDPGHVATAVAAALGLAGGPGGAAGQPTPPEMQVEDFVRANEPLLLLDNCEHVVQAVAQLTKRLLQAAPGARVLATSREPLGLTGEVAWSIPGLATPDPSLPADQLMTFDALRLFAERAAAAKPGFGLDERGARVAAEICRRLDGLPLAIELAAARVRTLPVEEIARRLDDRFRLLTTGGRVAVARQQTLRAAIDWSYDLLTGPELTLFVRLSVFAGSWTLEAAEAVCADERVPVDEVLEFVSRLVDRSLLRPEPGPTARFRMLETIRAYARERLEETGEGEVIRRRHAEHLLRAAEAAEAHPESTYWLHMLEGVTDDIRAALDWALAAGADDVLLRLAGALGWYWATWHDQQGIEWTTAILDAVRPQPSAAFGGALLAAAFAESYAPTPTTKARATQAVELLERFGQPAQAGRARLILAFIELMLGGDVAFAEGQVDTADRTFTELGDQWGRALAALSRFRLHLHAGSLERGLETGLDALQRFRSLGDPWGVPWTTLWLGTATRMSGDIQAAARLFEEAVASSEQLVYVRCAAHAELGVLAALEGDHQRARRHLDIAAELAPTTGVRDSVPTVANAAGLAARFRGRAAEAKRNHLHALEVFQEPQSDIGTAFSLCALGYAEHHLGQAAPAARHLRQAVTLAHRTGRPDITAAALEGLACTAVSHDAEGCALVLGAARRIRADTGIRLTAIEGHDPSKAERRAQAVLGAERFAAAALTGRGLSVEELMIAVSAHEESR